MTTLKEKRELLWWYYLEAGDRSKALDMAMGDPVFASACRDNLGRNLRLMVGRGGPDRYKRHEWTREEEEVLLRMLQGKGRKCRYEIAEEALKNPLLAGLNATQVKSKLADLEKTGGRRRRKCLPWAKWEADELAACVKSAGSIPKGAEAYISKHPERTIAECVAKAGGKASGGQEWSSAEVDDLLRMSEGNPVMWAVAREFSRKYTGRSTQAVYGKLFKLKTRPDTMQDWRIQDIGKHNLDLADQILSELDELARFKSEVA
ncbi:hypothetical protein [Dethiosulfovibrio salsuginis]|uniref:Myb-like domain-containing protein n=1 Tax=Dethiosulfovibrio salsuginis TaxID=561720 RepID=A0A1X7JIT1_9BACT|nr:hypothetical protein [Dethiosulfovibrio salsuginis]SMG27846.1 hypothetical protein SAMN06275492_11275 [Dethiosulfovibrio salsuginis]